ncbi:hypothetical protein [Pseudofrankia sp. BMG5.37]|uniref:SbtR family transcriptional regulator n=1 Tax=Pseudofrankia sp. BMG5.37 TaxID=3050035 RepID=UPI0037C94DF9
MTPPPTGDRPAAAPPHPSPNPYTCIAARRSSNAVRSTGPPLPGRAADRGTWRGSIEAGQRSGQLRDDLDPGDVLLALGGFALVLDRQPRAQDLARRLFDLLLGGLSRR